MRGFRQPNQNTRLDNSHPIIASGQLASLILPSAAYPALDLVTNQILTPVSSPTLSAGAGGIGHKTDGSASYSYRTITGLNKTFDLTIFALLQSNNNGTDKRAFSLGYTGSNNPIFAIDSSTTNAQKIRIFARSGNGSANTDTDSVSTPFDGGLHTVLLTANGSAGGSTTVNLYVDGYLDTSTGASGISNITTFDMLGVGALRRSLASSFWAGSIFLAGVVNRAISPAEAREISRYPFRLFKTKPKTYWPGIDTSTPTITFRSYASNGAAAPSSLAVNNPTGTVDNDLLIAVIQTATGAWSAPSGWVLQESDTTVPASEMYVYTKTASSEPSSYTFTCSPISGVTDISISCYTSSSASGPKVDSVGVIVDQTGIASTSVTASSITTANAGLLLGILGSNVPGTSWTTTSGWTTDFDESSSAETSIQHITNNTVGATGTKTFVMPRSSTVNAVLMQLYVSTSIERKALILSSNRAQQITNAQLGTGLKPLVLYNNRLVERQTTEGTPVVLVNNRFTQLQAGEILLI